MGNNIMTYADHMMHMEVMSQKLMPEVDIAYVMHDLECKRVLETTEGAELEGNAAMRDSIYSKVKEVFSPNIIERDIPNPEGVRFEFEKNVVPCMARLILPAAYVIKNPAVCDKGTIGETNNGS